MRQSHRGCVHQTPLSQKTQTDPTIQKSLCCWLPGAEDGKNPTPQRARFYDELKFYGVPQAKMFSFKLF